MSAVEAALFNGNEADSVPLAARGLHYGDGVFRTCLIVDGRVLDWEGQIARLSADAARLKLDPTPVTVAEEAGRLAAGQKRAVLKMLLMRAGEGRGYRPAGGKVDRLLLRYAAPRHPADCWDQGVAAFLASTRLARQPALAGVKHLNRIEQVLASAEWGENCEEGILSDMHGKLVSGTRSNLFWTAGGRLQTPSLRHAGVAGRMRERVLQLAIAQGLPCEEVEAGAEALERAEEIFLTNSLIGLWPVRRIGTRELMAPGPVCRQLSARLAHPRLD